MKDEVIYIYVKGSGWIPKLNNDLLLEDYVKCVKLPMSYDWSSFCERIREEERRVVREAYSRHAPRVVFTTHDDYYAEPTWETPATVRAPEEEEEEDEESIHARRIREYQEEHSRWRLRRR